MADLLGCDAGGVVFGRSMTQLTYDVARALAKSWGPGDEVVVTRLDHDANIRPWVQRRRAARRDRALGRLRPGDRRADRSTRACCRTRTRLVAVTGASNLLGTRPDIARDRRRRARGRRAAVRRRGAPDPARAGRRRGDSGADFYACSPYKFFGPHHGVLVADPALLELRAPGQAAALDRRGARAVRARHPALRDARRHDRGGRLHRRPGARRRRTSRRGRVLESMQRVEAYEEVLFERLLSGLDAIDGVRCYGRPARRTPTVLFSVDGRTGRRGVRAPGGARRERAGEQLLRARGVAVDGPRRHRRGAGGPRAVHLRGGRRPAARRGRRGSAAVSRRRSWSPGRRGASARAVAAGVRRGRATGSRCTTARSARRRPRRCCRRCPATGTYGAGRPGRRGRGTARRWTRRPSGSAGSTCWSTTPASSWRTRR